MDSAEAEESALPSKAGVRSSSVEPASQSCCTALTLQAAVSAGKSTVCPVLGGRVLLECSKPVKTGGMHRSKPISML